MDRPRWLDDVIVIHRRRHSGPALWRHEVHCRHAASLRAVDVGVQVVADEQHFIELDAEGLAERVEDGGLRFAFAVLVRENHCIEKAGEIEATENRPKRIAGCAPGVADQSESVAASRES